MKTERFEQKISPPDKSLIRRAASKLRISMGSFTIEAEHSALLQAEGSSPPTPQHEVQA